MDPITLIGGVLGLILSGYAAYNLVPWHSVLAAPLFAVSDRLENPPTLSFVLTNKGNRQVVLHAADLCWYDADLQATDQRTGKKSVKGAWTLRANWGQEAAKVNGIPLALQPGETRTIKLRLPQSEPGQTRIDVGLSAIVTAAAKTYHSQYPVAVAVDPDPASRSWRRLESISTKRIQLVSNAIKRPTTDTSPKDLQYMEVEITGDNSSPRS